MNERNMNGVIRLISEAQSIALCCHLNPDGDALGSMLAMRLGLLALGKDCEVFCQDPVPDYLKFLPGAEKVRMPEDAQGKLQETLQRVVNEGSGGLICIIL